MLSVEDAFARVIAPVRPLTTERIAVARASGRVLAAPVSARRSQPAANLSAMDGYAVRSADLSTEPSGGPVALNVVSTSAAGGDQAGTVRPGEAVRIFTGGVVPEGADQVVIQEECSLDGTMVSTATSARPGAHIRVSGADFVAGQDVLSAGDLLTPKRLGLLAAAGYGHVMVHRAPRVAILATGDEILDPDTEEFGPHQTADSASPMIAALLADSGAEIKTLSRVGDEPDAIKRALSRAAESHDLVVTIGGASVGARDHVGDALAAAGFASDFWRIAMRPGKPMMMAHKGPVLALGLPGNAVSAFVCALVFARSVIDGMMGRPMPFPKGVPVPLAGTLPQNGPRTHFIRARLTEVDGKPAVDPASAQDSSLVSVLAASDGLIIQPANSPEMFRGAKLPFLPF